MTKPALTFERLADWVDQRLSEEESESVAKQLETADAATQETVTWLKTFIQAGKASKLAAPPPEVHAELIRRFQADRQNQPNFLQRLVAALTFDSHTQFATAGVRAVDSPAAQRQLIYSTDLLDIAINIQLRPHDPHFDITGEVFLNRETDAVPFSIQLLQAEAEVSTTVVNENNEFAFEAIPAGEYSIVISALQIEILIVPVEVKL